MSDEKIMIENINIPGKTYLARKDKYEAMLKAFWRVLPTASPGLTQAEMFSAVIPHLPEELFPGGKTAGWWVKTVQLDQEAKGNLIREKTKPLRWYRERATNDD
jgi:hypothetical protein